MDEAVERPGPTCDDCFFRRAELCALPGNTPCPTFRPARPDGDAIRTTADAGWLARVVPAAV